MTSALGVALAVLAIGLVQLPTWKWQHRVSISVAIAGATVALLWPSRSPSRDEHQISNACRSTANALGGFLGTAELSEGFDPPLWDRQSIDAAWRLGVSRAVDAVGEMCIPDFHECDPMARIGGEALDYRHVIPLMIDSLEHRQPWCERLRRWR
jgi:hypothetical protein